MLLSDPLKSVSRETIEKLEHYQELLIKWQKSINLVSSATIPDAWERHFRDSAQLMNYIQDHAKTLLDLGSGAGFPGLVLAILRPDMKIHLIESDSKKCSFLRTVSRETNTGVTIHNDRIEKLVHTDIHIDILSARALASLSGLLHYAQPFVRQNQELELLLMKGAKAREELEEVQKTAVFDVDLYDSITDAKGKILHVRNVKYLQTGN